MSNTSLLYLACAILARTEAARAKKPNLLVSLLVASRCCGAANVAKLPALG